MNKLFLLIATIALLSASCKKSSDDTTYTCTTCVSAPEAKAANDASSKGIYKGSFIGSSGTIKFDILNDPADTQIKAYLTIDGTEIVLTSQVSWQNGVAYVGNFVGIMPPGGQPLSITFKVDANGGNPIVTASNIPGHPNAVFSIIKELSTNLIEVFEGTYETTKPDAGTFNMVLSRSLSVWKATSKSNSGVPTDGGSGIITANNEIYDTQRSRVLGVINGDKIEGSFLDADGKNVNISGKRTY